MNIDLTLLIVGCVAVTLAGMVALVAVIQVRRKRSKREDFVALSEISRDWAPTWRINAVSDAWVMENEKDDIPANFALRIEENRMVRDIGGGEVMECRWRPPTKAEVREIVRRYHSTQSETKVPLAVTDVRRQFSALGVNSKINADSGPRLRDDRSTAAATLVPASGLEGKLVDGAENRANGMRAS